MNSLPLGLGERGFAEDIDGQVEARCEQRLQAAEGDEGPVPAAARRKARTHGLGGQGDLRRRAGLRPFVHHRDRKLQQARARGAGGCRRRPWRRSWPPWGGRGGAAPRPGCRCSSLRISGAGARYAAGAGARGDSCGPAAAASVVVFGPPPRARPGLAVQVSGGGLDVLRRHAGTAPGPR